MKLSIETGYLSSVCPKCGGMLLQEFKFKWDANKETLISVTPKGTLGCEDCGEDVVRKVDPELARKLAGAILNTWAYGAPLPTGDDVDPDSADIIQRYGSYLYEAADKAEKAMTEWVTNNPPLKEDEPTMDIITVTRDEMGPAWDDVIGDRNLISCAVADFGFADAQVVLMTFVDGYEVGHGECMRPYSVLYKGNDLKKAVDAWVEHIARLGGDTRGAVQLGNSLKEASNAWAQYCQRIDKEAAE